MKKQLILISQIFIIIFILWGCNFSNNQNSKDLYDVKIACNIPLTGNFSSYGVPIRDGLNMALKERSSDSVNFIVDIQDNGGQTKNSISVYQKQIIQEPDIYVSGIAQQTIALLKKTDEKNLPHFAWLFEPYVIGEHKSAFRTWVNFLMESEYYLNFLKQTSPQKLAIINVNTDGTNTQFNDIIKPEAFKLGVKDILHESYNIPQTNFNNIAAMVKAFKPDIIILNGFKHHMIELVRTFREQKLIQDGNTICSLDLLDAASDLNNNELEGLRVTTPYFVSKSNIDKIIEWRNRFKKTYNRDPLYTDAYAYDMGTIIIEASKFITQKKASNWFDAIRLINSEGITGKLEFKESGELVYSAEICYYNDGQLIPLY